MKHVIEYKLFESKEVIIDNCLDILIDINDDYIPVDVKKGSVYSRHGSVTRGPSYITIEIGDNEENMMKKRFWSFNEYILEFSRLNVYLESEGYHLVDGFVYYDLYYNRGTWNRTSKSFLQFSDLIKTIVDNDYAKAKGWHYRDISFIDLVYKKK